MTLQARAELAELAVAGSPAYRSAWKAFQAWCRGAEQLDLPATPATVLAYLGHRFRAEGRAASTLDVAICAIFKAHDAAGLPSPASAELRALVAEARRQALPASVDLDQVRAVSGACGEDAAGLRDRALLLAVHHAHLFRVRAVALDVEDLVPNPAEWSELATLRLRHPDALLCPVLALERWLAVRGNPPKGALFVGIHPQRARRFGARLRVQDVNRILEHRGTAAGMDGLTPLAFRTLRRSQTDRNGDR